MTDANSSEASGNPANHALPPTSVVRQARPRWDLGVYWLLPLSALIGVGSMVYYQWITRGVVIRIHFSEGHNLKPGDAVRYRGITVGHIRSVVLANQAKDIMVEAELDREAANIASDGSRFWIVRPQLDWTGLRGSDTIIGANYVAVHPGIGAPSYEFVGLEEPPIVDFSEPGGIQIVLQAKRRGGLRAGVPVWYRQVRVGSVVSVGLASDASAVEARVNIQSSYVNLIRDNTKFWNVSGLRMEGSFTGLKMELDSAESLFAGGVALATPDSPGRMAVADQRFSLEETANAEWLQWRPSIPLGAPNIPAGLSAPRPVRAQLTYQRKGVIRNDRITSIGWVLPISNGIVIGPKDVLVPPPDALNAELEIAGRAMSPPGVEPGSSEQIVRVRFDVPEQPFQARRIRKAEAVQDVYLIGDSNQTPRNLSAAWMTALDSGWLIDSKVPLGNEWHGAVALAPDGNVVGMLLAPDKGQARLVPVVYP